MASSWRGHIEKDEALLRESREESNLEIELLNNSPIPLEGNIKKNLAIPFYVNIHSVEDHDHCCLHYVCKSLNPENLKIDKKELNDARWFSKEDLSLDYVPVDVKNIGLVAFEIYLKKN